MINKKIKIIFPVIIISAVALQGCQTDSKTQVLATSESQVKLRAMQSRSFDTGDRDRTLRTVIATLQDLGFVIDKADETLGSVSATKLDIYMLKMTVTVRQQGDAKVIVRANAQYNIQAVEDPEPYQQFFASLEKAMFLSANAVE